LERARKLMQDEMGGRRKTIYIHTFVCTKVIKCIHILNMGGLKRCVHGENYSLPYLKTKSCVHAWFSAEVASQYK